MDREGLKTEFKRIYVKDIIKSVVAFANTAGGKIYIGVDDSGDIIGLENADAELLKLSNAIRDNIKPDITEFATSSFETIDSKTIIVYEIQKGTSSPYYLSAKGLRPEGVYVRQGASSVPASQSLIIKMIKETDGESYENLRSLNQDLTFETLQKEFDASDIKLETPQMKSLLLIDEDDLYTNLGLLLSDQCQHSIKAAVFEGISKSLFKDRYEFTGSVMKQMREVYSFIDRYNRTRSQVVGLDRLDTREYPEQAVREALLNSIVHKDYAFGSSTLLSVFDDRLELLTVGGLVKGLTKNDIMIGTSILRNKNLANVFYRLNWVEAYGTGILKIKEAYSAYEIEPLFEITDNAFKVTLPAIKLIKNEAKSKVHLNVSEKKILEMFKSNASINRKAIETELKISQPMAVKLLKVMLEKKLIQRTGSGKNTRYELTSNQ